jgi:signal transduction histidine kinase
MSVVDCYDVSDVLFSQAWPDGLIEVRDGKVHQLNSQVTYYLGWSCSDLSGRHVHQVLCRHSTYCDHHENDCPFASSDDACLQAREAYWVHKDQHNIAINYRVVPTTRGSLLIIFQSCDILGYQVNELRKLSTFTEINPAPLLEVDAQGLILFSNPAMTDLMLSFGFNESGQARVLPSDLSTSVRLCLTQGQALLNIESEVSDEDNPGIQRYFLWRFHPLKYATRESVLICGVDISSKKEMEQQEARFQQIIEQEKTKARKEYMAKMVHELRSPLNMVVGFASVLKHKLGTKISQNELAMIDQIIEGGNQLAEQISITLQSSRVELGKLHAEIAEFELNQILFDLADKLKVMADEKKLQMSAEIPEKPLRVRADILHLRQTVINLISNAIKYTPSGFVKLMVHEVEDQEIGLGVAISVQDSGSGIPEHEKDHIFELFKRKQEDENSGIEGDGVGLALCVEMMALNHGRILLESEPGVGSIFTVVFPRA